MVILGVLIGCAATPESASPALPADNTNVAQQEDTGDPVVERTPQNLVLWHSMTANSGVVLDELIAKFNETVGTELNINVEAIFQGSYADSSAQLRILLETGNTTALPDISQIDATGMIDIKDSPYLARASAFATADPDFDISQIHQVMLNNITYMDELLGMPFAISMIVMYYNRDMLNEAGFDAPPSTLADMAEMLPALTQVNADGSVDIYGFALSPATPTIQSWIGQQNEVSFIVDNRNGRAGDPTRVVFDEEGTMAVFLNEWRNLHATGGLRHIEGNTMEEFTAERIAMMVGSSSNIAPMLRAIDGRFDLGVAFFPRVNEQASYGATQGGSSLFMFDKNDPDRTTAAWEVLKFLASDEVQAQWSAGTGYFAVNVGSPEFAIYQDNLEMYPQFGVVVQQLYATHADMQGIWIPSSFQVFTEFRNGVISMIENDRSVEETINDLAITINDILDEFHLLNR